MKDDTSTPTPEGSSPNEFERGKPGTAARDQAEAAIEKLRREGGVFVDAVRATRMAMAVTDPNLPGNPIIFANKSFLKLSGYRMEEVLGQQPHFMNGPDTDPKDAARFAEALQADHDDIIETVQYRKNGTRFVATVLISAFKDDRGHTAHHFMSWLDVTRRVDAEDELESLRSIQSALRESNARHRLLIESWAQAIWETNAEGVVVNDSPSWRAYTGQTLEEWLGWGWLDAVHPDDREYAERQWREPVAAQSLVNAEFRLRAPDGSWHWTNVRAAPVVDKHGVIEKWAGMNIDIDARKRAEDRLRESEVKYRTLFETMGQGYCSLELVRDENGRAVDQLYLDLNPAFERIFSVPVAQAKGRRASDVFPDLNPVWTETFDRVSKTSKPERLEHSFDDGRWFEVFAHPAGDDRLIVLYEDVTERKQAELALRGSEEQQAFLLKLSDALRAVSAPDDVQKEASRILREQLGADRVAYAEIDADGTTARLLAEDVRPGVAPLPSKVYSWADFDPVGLERATHGESVARADVNLADELTEAQKLAFAAVGFRALINVPLIKSGQLVAFIAVHFVEPREITPAEISLVEETAERTWAAVESSRAQDALRKSEEKYRTLFEKMGQGFVEAEVVRDTQGSPIDSRLLELNPAFERLTGVSVEAARGHTNREIFPGIEDWWALTADRIVRSGKPETVEYQVAPLGRSYSAHFYPASGDRYTAFYEDITDRKRAEDTLRESEVRQAFLLRLSDEMRPLSDSAAIKAAATRLLGEHLKVNRAFYADAAPGQWLVTRGFEERIAPLPDRPFDTVDYGDWIIDGFRQGRHLVIDNMNIDERLSPAERQAHLDLHIGAEIALPLVKDGELLAMVVVQSAEPRNWTDEEIALLSETAERTWAAVERTRAEGALRDSERRATLLLAELQHRVRNTLSVVRSISLRTADNSSSVEEMLAHFQGRLDAFSRVQAALTRSPSATVDLASLIEDEMVAHAAREGEQVSIEGPDIDLEPKTAERLSLAIHELTTNAVKHGAFVNAAGKVRIRWSREQSQAGSVLQFSWTESGVTIDPSETRRKGFGMELLQRSLPYDLQASTSVDFRPTGLHFEFSMPLRTGEKTADRQIGSD